MNDIFLQGCNRNISSNTEDLTEHQLRAGRSSWPPERNIRIHTKLAEWRKGKRESGWTEPAPMGAAARERSPVVNQLGQRWTYLRLSEGKAAGSGTVWVEWEPHSQPMPWPCIPWTGTSPPECVAGSWSVAIGEKSQGEDCCWLWWDSPRDKRKEIAVGNVWGKPGSHGGRVPLLSHTQRVSQKMIALFFTQVVASSYL